MNDAAVWYERYGTELYRFAFSIPRDREAAEDVMQDAFLKAMQRLDGACPVERVRAWLYRVARNECYDLLRKRKHERSLPEEAAGGAEALEYLELLAPLTQVERDIVSLKIIGNLSHKEIAAVMHLTVHGAKKRYERALDRLFRPLRRKPRPG